MADLTCDVAVIGAGTAGLAAERNARKHGARTLLIDPEFAGTTCATVGCMPSKLLIAAARSAHRARQAGLFGIATGPVTVDGPAVMARLRAERDRFVRATRDGFDTLPEGICVRVRARARFAPVNSDGVNSDGAKSDGTKSDGTKSDGPCQLVLDDGRRVTARAVVIATGSAPMVPGPFGDLGTLDDQSDLAQNDLAQNDLALTNETLFELTDLPARLAVIGGGVIGLELAQAMARLGVAVTLFDMGDRLAGVRCTHVHDALQTTLAQEITLRLGTPPRPSRQGNQVRIDWDDGTDLFDRVLLATGRPPNVAGLGLENTGLTLDDHGLPEVDPQTLQCAAPDHASDQSNGPSGRHSGRHSGSLPIFMVGDANGDRPVLHEASDEGAIAGRNAATYPAVDPTPRKTRFAITFTDPPLVSIGEGPDDSAKIGTADYTDQGRARVEGENIGLARLYAEAPDGRLIGADLFCPGADHMGHLLAWAIEAGMTATDLLERPYYHPTLEEGLRSALKQICRAVPLDLPGHSDPGQPPGT